jgi:hypothetical protein
MHDLHHTVTVSSITSRSIILIRSHFLQYQAHRRIVHYITQLLETSNDFSRDTLRIGPQLLPLFGDPDCNTSNGNDENQDTRKNDANDDASSK